jgi:sugar lactone lactonase YvrE
VSAVRCVAPTGDRCGEAAIWSTEERAVYWTDVTRFLLHRYDADSGSVRSWFFDEPVVALSLTTRADTLLVGLGSRLVLWNPATDARRDHGFVLAGSPRVRLNDGRTDPLGNFWVGSMKNNVEPDGELGDVGPGEGVLFRIAPDGATTEEVRGLGISNTLCWSPDRRHFYFGDTLANEIRVYDYDAADGRIAGGRTFFAGAPRGLPDGSAIDAEGCVWNCRFGGGCILRVAPSGEVIATVEMPVPNITTCAFGGPDLKTLFITTAGRPSEPGDRLAGGLFALDAPAPGLPENRFRLR